jgi:hypothetical protein
MTRYLSVWKAPRSRGTAITYGLYNGLRAQGLDCEYQNEPLHWRRLEPYADDPEGFADYVARTDGSRDLDGVDVVIQKRNAKWIYDHRHGHRFDSLTWIENLTNVILLRDLAAMIRDHRDALQRASAPDTPSELTLDVLGIPQLFWLHRTCRDCGIPAPVLDADDLLTDPATGMQTLCDTVDVDYDPAMVEWDEVDLKTPPWGEVWGAELRRSRGLQTTRNVDKQEVDVDAHIYWEARRFVDRMRDTAS